MSFNPEELQEILSIYKAESEEHLQKLGQLLLRLEKEPGKLEVLEEVFREAHSLKGSSRMIGFTAVEQVSHRLEDLFGAARKGELELTSGALDVVFKALDAIARVTEAWLCDPTAETEKMDDILALISGVGKRGKEGGRGKEPPPPPSPERPTGKGRRPAPEEAPPAVPVAAALPVAAAVEEKSPKEEARGEKVKFEVEETIRVTTQKLDDLMNRIGEILVTKIKFDQRLAEIRRLEAEVEDVSRFWKGAVRMAEMLGDSPTPEENRKLAEARREAGERITALREGCGHLVSVFNEDSLRLTLISSELQESINRVRMLPLSQLFNLFPRLLRDIARGEGKDVELVVGGGAIQLDKMILEELKDPLMHLLRNAVDHGLETPREREAAGKEAAGRISLTAVQKANSVLLEIEDDGAGLDLEKIREIALRRGFVTGEQLEEMTAQQTMSLIFRPGFSTKGIITDLSGRGVGLDVVYNGIEKMKGTITLSSVPGKGTRFSIKLPITLATSQSLFVRVEEQVFAIPLTSVEIIMEVGLADVMTVESREAILVEGTPTALVRLHEILGLPADPFQLREGEKTSVVVLGSTEERVAMMVSEVVGEKEIVVKGLGSQLRRVKNVSGATIMGDGSVVLILNVFDLIKSSQKVRGLWVAQEKRRAEDDRRRPEILVVDDSVTTRVLEKNILEGSGYRVTLAVDGTEALEKIRSRPFDLVVTDVEMPRMDGFELTRQLRREDRFKELPVILVTSLDSDADRRKGAEAGADAYITKGAFEQGNLLTTIRQLL